LQTVWPEHGERASAEWRLLGAIACSGLRGFSKLKARIDKLSGVTSWRWHDLRRTARTGMTRLGRCIGHRSLRRRRVCLPGETRSSCKMKPRTVSARRLHETGI
jgi:hypothetical protein